MYSKEPIWIGVVKMKIMLVDDDQGCLDGLVGVLEPSGHICETFTLPHKALEKYSGRIYDMVITDLKMPRMSGFDLFNEIRLVNPEAKVIINTGFGDLETVVTALNTGVYTFFEKPIDIVQLLGTIDQIEQEIRSKNTVLQNGGEQCT